MKKLRLFPTIQRDIVTSLHYIAKPALNHYNIDPRFIFGKIAPIFSSISNMHTYDSLVNFCMFIGHGRSGSTLIGSLLNAHPNIVISNELDVLEYIDKGLQQKQIFCLIYFISKRFVKHGSVGGGDYAYTVPGQWQGKHKELFVIGDRKAGATSSGFLIKPELLKKFKNVITLEKKFIHVIRNPFDTISTSFKKTPRKPGEKPEEHLKRQIRFDFMRCSAVQSARREFGDANMMDLFHEDLIADPQKSLKEACDFLGVDSTQDYLEACAKIVKKRPHKARWSVEWPDDLIGLVNSQLNKFPWLKRYSYDSQ